MKKINAWILVIALLVVCGQTKKSAAAAPDVDIWKAAASGKLLQQKSPLVAGLLSACVPGAGHFYCGKFRNGGVAFVLSAAFVAASVEAFHKDVYAGGAIASSVALVFYSGTIYGAVNVAHKFNKARREQLLSEMRRKFGDERLLLMDRLYR